MARVRPSFERPHTEESPSHERSRSVPRIFPMIEESDLLAVGREARIGDVAEGAMEHMPERKLETVLAADAADDQHAVTIGGPVGPAHMLEKLSRRAAEQRHAGQRPFADPVG